MHARIVSVTVWLYQMLVHMVLTWFEPVTVGRVWRVSFV